MYDGKVNPDNTNVYVLPAYVFWTVQCAVRMRPVLTPARQCCAFSTELEYCEVLWHKSMAA